AHGRCCGDADSCPGRRSPVERVDLSAPGQAQEEEGRAVSEGLQVEATGETVGEAKWQALRELERVAPGLDKSAVRFEVVSEGERGLLGVGYAPARVVATVDAEAVAAAPPAVAGGGSSLAADLRELLTRVVAALAVDCE